MFVIVTLRKYYKSSHFFADDGCVILKMIAEITLMKKKPFVKIITEVVPRASSNVKTINVYPVDGAVTTIMIVAINQMKKTAVKLNAEYVI